jgi:hypothetical protein
MNSLFDLDALPGKAAPSGWFYLSAIINGVEYSLFRSQGSSRVDMGPLEPGHTPALWRYENAVKQINRYRLKHPWQVKEWKKKQ